MPEEPSDTNWLGIDVNALPPGSSSFFAPTAMPQSYAVPGSSPLAPEQQYAQQQGLQQQVLQQETYKQKLSSLQMLNRAIQQGAQALPEIARLNPDSETYPSDTQAAVSKFPLALSDPRVAAVMAEKDKAYNQKRQWQTLQQAQERELRTQNADVLKEIHTDPELFDVYNHVAGQAGSEAGFYAVRTTLRDRGYKDKLRASGYKPKEHGGLEQFMVPGKPYLSHDAVEDWIAENGVVTKPETASERGRNATETHKANLEILKLMNDPTYMATLTPEARAEFAAEVERFKGELGSVKTGTSASPLSKYLNGIPGTSATPQKKGLGLK